MDIVSVLRDKIKHSSDIVNLGICLDVNKLIALLNNIKVLLIKKDQKISILSYECRSYIKMIRDHACEHRISDGKCDKSCNKYNSETKFEWCDPVTETTRVRFDKESADSVRNID